VVLNFSDSLSRACHGRAAGSKCSCQVRLSDILRPQPNDDGWGLFLFGAQIKKHPDLPGPEPAFPQTIFQLTRARYGTQGALHQSGLNYKTKPIIPSLAQ
jgi:hypothetical protein